MRKRQKRTLISGDTTLGKELSVARTRAGLKQEEVADKAEINRVTLSHMENDEYPPSAELLLRLCRLYHTTPEAMGFHIIGTAIVPLRVSDVAGQGLQLSPFSSAPDMMRDLVQNHTIQVPVWAPPANQHGIWKIGSEGRQLEPVMVPLSVTEGRSCMAFMLGPGDLTMLPFATQDNILIARTEEDARINHIALAIKGKRAVFRALGPDLRLRPLNAGEDTLDPAEWVISGTLVGIIKDYAPGRLTISFARDGFRLN